MKIYVVAEYDKTDDKEIVYVTTDDGFAYWHADPYKSGGGSFRILQTWEDGSLLKEEIFEKKAKYA